MTNRPLSVTLIILNLLSIISVLKEQEIAAEAGRLDRAERNREQVRPTTVTYPDMTMDDAYAIQKAWVDRKIAAGRRIIGYKIGLTSRAMQAAMQIDEPDYGVLLDDMRISEGSDIVAADFPDPRLEVELAFVLKGRLEGPDVSVDDVVSATDYVLPALELIAARSFRVDPETGKPRTVLDTISDNAANAGIIAGRNRIDPSDIDLRWVGAMMYRNGVLEETGLAAGVLDHPANGVSWVARRFSRHGVALEPGQIILAGSFTRPVIARAGDSFRTDFGPLGEISCRFV